MSEVQPLMGEDAKALVEIVVRARQNRVDLGGEEHGLAARCRRAVAARNARRPSARAEGLRAAGCRGDYEPAATGVNVSSPFSSTSTLKVMPGLSVPSIFWFAIALPIVRSITRLRLRAPVSGA